MPECDVCGRDSYDGGTGISVTSATEKLLSAYFVTVITEVIE